MDVSKYAESDYITADLVKISTSKKAIILSDAKVEQTEFGEKISLEVEIDGKKKTYRPNKDTIKNLMSAYGKDSKSWLGKTVSFVINSVMGKETVIGVCK